VLAALNNQTFSHLFEKAGKGFEEVTYASGCRQLSRSMAAMAPAFMTLITMVGKICYRTRACGVRSRSPGMESSSPTRYFAILAQAANGGPLTAEAAWTRLPQPGIEVWRLEILTETARGCGRHGARQRRGDLDESKQKAQATGWMLRWRAQEHRDGIGAVVKVVTSAGAQYNHMTTSVGLCLLPATAGALWPWAMTRRPNSWKSAGFQEAVQTLQDVVGDRVLNVKESAGK